MKKTLLFCFALLAMLLPASAENTGLIYGFIKNNMTKETLMGVKVTAYTGTTKYQEYITRKEHTFNYIPGPWKFNVPKTGGKYRLVIEKEGYETVEAEIEVKPFKKSEMYRYVQDFYLKRKPKEHKIGEAVVRATRVKIYHKGDTVMYDADAFNLADGSMLDGLIKSLPGAVLKDDGEIFVNGKKVDALLLNGEYFFKRNNKVMLENLPAYMVKTVKVYDKKSIMSEATGVNMDDGEYVMDVNLKKQYSIGWIGNMEAGIGTSDRYLARLFALRFTDASRVGGYVNLNNLNDNRKPGEDSEWTPAKMPRGLISRKVGGIDYLLKPKNTTHRFQGNVDVSYTDADNYGETSTENYLPSGNTFGKSMSHSKASSFNISSDHSLMIRDRKGQNNIYLDPYFNYRKYDNRSNSLSAMFNRNPTLTIPGNGLLDSLKTMHSPELMAMTLNRLLSSAKSDGHKLSMGTGLNCFGTLYANSLRLGGRISYESQKDNLFDRRTIDYPNQPGMVTDFRNRYIHDSPNRNLNYNTDVAYFRRFDSGTQAYLSYDFGQRIKRRNYELNRLDALSDWAENTKHELGELPSERDFRLRTLDAQNSYNQHEINTYNDIQAHFSTNYWPRNENSKRRWYELTIALPISINHYRLNYSRANYSGVTRRDAVFFNPSISGYYSWKEQSRAIDYRYELSHGIPQMTNLIEIENNADPLNIYLGNSQLKNYSRHEAEITYRTSNDEKELSFSVTPRYIIYTNSIAYGYVMDKTTGVRRYSPDNVNGSYLLSMNVSYARPLDKKKLLTMRTNTYGHIDHGVDLIGLDDGSAPVRSSVCTYWGTERINLDYKLGKHSIGAKGYLGVGHTASGRKDFDNLTLYDFNYGLTALLQFPLDIQLSTDLTMYSRRGYANRSANTNDLVWNARLSKRFAKQRLTVTVDGFDLLGKLSNISQLLNSQGRTESYYNALPRYVMFHVIYRFAKQPKKK